MAMFNSFLYVMKPEGQVIIPGFGRFGQPGQPLAASPLDQSGSLPVKVPELLARPQLGGEGPPMAGSLAILVLLITMVSLSRKKKAMGDISTH